MNKLKLVIKVVTDNYISATIIEAGKRLATITEGVYENIVSYFHKRLK